MLDRSKQGYNAHSPSVRQVRHRFVRHRVTTLAGPMQHGPDTGLQHSLVLCNMGQTKGYNARCPHATWARHRVTTPTGYMLHGQDTDYNKHWSATGLHHSLAQYHFGQTQETIHTGPMPHGSYTLYKTHWNTTWARHKDTTLTGMPHGPDTGHNTHWPSATLSRHKIQHLKAK